MTDYSNIDRPYDSQLSRESDLDVVVGGEGVSTSGGDAYSQSEGGSAEEAVVKSEGSMGDLWITNWIKSSEWKPKTQGFYLDGKTGYAEFSNVYISGSLTLNTTSSISGGQTDYDTGTGFFLGYSGGAYKFSVGVGGTGPSFLWNGSVASIKGSIITSPAVGTDISLFECTHNITFTSTSDDSISWTAGTITLSNGQTFAIGAGTLTGITTNVVYLDIVASTTVLQTSTTIANAVGANKILLGYTQKSTDPTSNAQFIPSNGVGGLTINEERILIPNLAAVNADMGAITAGTITLNSSGHIKSGQSAYDTGNGFWLGMDGLVEKFSLGVGGIPEENLRWDGTKMIVNGYELTGLGVYGGDGSDGALTVSGTTTLNAGQLYQYTSVTIQNGGTLKFTGNGIGKILVSGNFTMESGSAIDLRKLATTKIGGVVGIHALEGGNPLTVVTNSTGGFGGAAGANGGDGGEGIGAGAGTGGAAGTNAASPTIGTDGVDGTTNTTGGGGGGGGGAVGAGGTAPTAGGNASGVNGGLGGNGGSSTGDGGSGGGGGGGTSTGNGGDGGNGGNSTSAGDGGDGGKGGDSGPSGGSGGSGGDGGNGAGTGSSNNRGGDGGDGGDGYTNGGDGGNGGDGSNNVTTDAPGGVGGNGGDALYGLGGDGGNGGDSYKGADGAAGGAGGDGYDGGNGGNGGNASETDGAADGGIGGAGGNANSGALPLYVFAAGNISLNGNIYANGGTGGDGGAGGKAYGGGDGGDGGAGGDGSDVYLLCKGTFTNNGIIINTSGGLGGRAGALGISVASNIPSTQGRQGRQGINGKVIMGNITI